MIRLVARKIHPHRYQIYHPNRQSDSCDLRKYCTRNENARRVPMSHIDTLKNSNATSNKAPTRSVQDDDSQTFVQHIVNYVEKTTYMEDVRAAQSRVMAIKTKLLKKGEEKRNLMTKIEDLRNDLNHIYKDMKINRSKDAYLDLARKEIELCELEKQYSDTYKNLDKEEQYLFTEFSTAINDSYEKEKLHTNFIKVISIIGTITSSFVALILSILFHVFQYNKYQNIKPIDDDVLKSINSRLGTVEKAVSRCSDNRESWGSYLHRNTRWIYSWAIKTK